MKKLVFVVGLVILCCFTNPSRPVLSKPAPQGGGLSFRDIVGTNGLLPSAELNKELKVGFARVQVAWSEISRAKGSYNWEKSDGPIRQAQDQGIGVVADLTFTANWASSRPNLGSSQWQFFPPNNVSDWTDFIDAAVTHYMASPYNVKYFQIWNEPTKGAGFWKGDTDQQWVDMIYIPAAKVIKRHGANVVFGGWPSGSSMAAYINELNYHNAWQYTDILDVHYYPILANWPALYNQFIATGKCKGIWETEIGAHSDPQGLATMYTNTYNWARNQGHWSFPDQYKLFWFPGFGATDATALTRQGPTGQGPVVLTANGKALQAVAQKLP